jgi:hypothetical protein
MDASFVASSYLAMVLSVIYATRGQGRRSCVAMGVGLAALLAATFSGDVPERIANHALILILVGFGSAVMFGLSKRKKSDAP